MKINVEVTQEDISQGVRQNIVACPVANALKRVLKASTVTVGHEYNRAYYSGLIKQLIDIPHEVNERITKYDKTGEMTPFCFEATLHEKTPMYS